MMKKLNEQTTIVAFHILIFFLLVLFSILTLACGSISETEELNLNKNFPIPTETVIPNIFLKNHLAPTIKPSMKASKKIYKIVCSMPGTYVFHFEVFNNTCSEKFSFETEWLATWEIESFPCGIYWQDGWSAYKNDPKIQLYCEYTTYMEPEGIGIEVKCNVYKMLMPFIPEEICKFSYSSPIVSPI